MILFSSYVNQVNASRLVPLIVSEYPDQRDRQTSPRYRLMMATTATTVIEAKAEEEAA